MNFMLYQISVSYILLSFWNHFRYLSMTSWISFKILDNFSFEIRLVMRLLITSISLSVWRALLFPLVSSWYVGVSWLFISSTRMWIASSINYSNLEIWWRSFTYFSVIDTFGFPADSLLILFNNSTSLLNSQ